MSVQSLLDKINGPRLEAVGTGGALATSLFYGRGLAPIAVVVLLILFVFTSTSHKLQFLLSRTLGKFTKQPAWTKYVSLGLVVMIAGKHGTIVGVLTIAFVLTIGVGILFDELY